MTTAAYVIFAYFSLLVLGIIIKTIQKKRAKTPPEKPTVWRKYEDTFENPVITEKDVCGFAEWIAKEGEYYFTVTDSWRKESTPFNKIESITTVELFKMYKKQTQ